MSEWSEAPEWSEPPGERVVPSIVIGVLTSRRTGDLGALLPELLDQAATVFLPVEILVIDYGPLAGARDQVAQTIAVESDQYTPIRYVHESNPGIATARNRALLEADGAGILIFIDEEERPTAGWLAHLLDTYAVYRSAAVVGPVLTQYDTEPDVWIRAGGFFDRRRFETGTSVALAATNNLLLDLAQIRSLGLSFDERFGPGGGSDSLFTRQLHQRGGELIWCDEAIVIDVVPADRLTRGWVLHRAYLMGNTWSRINLDDTASGLRVLVRVTLLARGAARVLAGLTRYLVGALVGEPRPSARGLRTAARGAGMLAGSVHHDSRAG